MENRSRKTYGVGLTVLLALVVWDVFPYRAGFSRTPPEPVQREYERMAEVLRESSPAGRYLSRELYHPEMDMLSALTDKASAWHWLNWSCPQPTHAVVVNTIYANLHSSETIEGALATAGVLHVRYLVYDLAQGPPPPATAGMRPLWAGNYYAVYENLLCRDLVQCYQIRNNESPPSRIAEIVDRKPMDETVLTAEQEFPGDRLTIQASTSHSLLMVLSQSAYPGWEMYVNDVPQKIQTVENLLPCVRLDPGKYNIQFRYHRPGYFLIAAVVSILILMGCVYILNPFPIRKKVHSNQSVIPSSHG